ncbi:hypothetical protein C8J57DRAFT_1508498 [Mycena rebaudengoi]|nr:hypothetical protein C8J57DRAFT_1508498 [Mycena rebaudengoi]
MCHTWLADELPDHLKFPSLLEIPAADEPIENWQVVPCTYPGKLEWAHVGRNPTAQDHTRQLVLVYKHPRIFPHAPANMLYPIGVRVQGFIHDCNLNPLGTWSGANDGPQKSLQFITMGGGGIIDNLFAKYKVAIVEIIEFIYRSLRLPVPSGKWLDSEFLYIVRRVFTKVTPKNRYRTCALQPGEDPTLLAKQVEANWRVLERLSVGMYVEDESEESDGFKVACNPMTLGHGDFVDVCIGFDIVTRNSSEGTTHQVHLKLEHVLLLIAAEDIPKEATEGEGEEYTVQPAGLSF